MVIVSVCWMELYISSAACLLYLPPLRIDPQGSIQPERKAELSKLIVERTRFGKLHKIHVSMRLRRVQERNDSREDVQESRTESLLRKQHSNLNRLPDSKRPDPAIRLYEKDIIRAPKYVYSKLASFTPYRSRRRVIPEYRNGIERRDLHRGNPSLAILVPRIKVLSNAPFEPLLAFR